MSTTLTAPSIVKTGSPATIAIGDTLTYNLVTHLAEGTTKALVVTDALPANLTYTGSTLITTAAASGGLLTADFGGHARRPVHQRPGHRRPGHVHVRRHGQPGRRRRDQRHVPHPRDGPRPQHRPHERPRDGHHEPGLGRLHEPEHLDRRHGERAHAGHGDGHRAAAERRRERPDPGRPE